MKTESQYIKELRTRLRAALHQQDWRAADRISAALTLALKASYGQQPTQSTAK